MGFQCQEWEFGITVGFNFKNEKLGFIVVFSIRSGNLASSWSLWGLVLLRSGTMAPVWS